MRWVLVICVALVLSGCANRTVTRIVPEALALGIVQPVHVATLRNPSETGWFNNERGDRLRFAQIDVAIPADHTRGVIRSGFARPDPQRQFTVGARSDLSDSAAFVGNLRAALAALPRARREVTLYVHGYNNSFLEGVYRAAQLMHDFDLPGAAVHFAWPSAANPLGYTYDRDSVLHARDALEALLRDIRRAEPDRIVIIAHSLGTMLVMETLRQIEIADPGWSKRALGGVILISPDLDIDLFKSQADRFFALPEPFAIFVNARDRALALSARINGASARLGNLTDASRLAKYPVTLVDISAFSLDSGSRHFTVGTSPTLIKLLSQSGELDAAFQRDRAGRSGLLPGTVITVQNATQLILSPLLLQPGSAAQP